MMPKGVSYQAPPGPDGPHPSATSTERHSENVTLKADADQKLVEAEAKLENVMLKEAEFAVYMANQDVLEAQAIRLVWKCKVFGWSFKTELQAFFSKLAWIDLSVKANLEIMTHTIYERSQSTVEADALQKLADAEKKLEKAEAKLAKAKGELEKAKSELKEAEAVRKEAQEKALAAGPTLEQVIVRLKTQPQRFKIRATPLVGRETALDAA